ncbi:MAG TPA: gamma-glutamyl-gamma-aminobutyrate hydrolase family protein, partial [Solirubrobacterales bacterium]|nr:gamma-glutamyl-gamma-aminobutyrate hydrolase family protein [Solirubrobacterales bacterium]
MKRRSLASRRQRPLIGVTTSEVRPKERVHPVPEGEPKAVEMALGITYLKGIEGAGGLPLVIPPLDPAAIEPLLDRLDGICLSGGPDLDPALYEAEPHPELGPIEPDLDRFELAVAARADAREMPMLAICRGTQALNIVRGGALHQHLPDVSTEVAHRQTGPGDEPSHPVAIDPDSRLAEVFGDGELEITDVNSFHHQAIDRLGDGLRISARAPDGTVEAIEDPSRRFLIGVQWHAE